MKPPARYFRAGVGAVITDGAGRVLAFERRDIPGAWQFPQGGLEDGETTMDAVFREIKEETGLSKTALQLLRRYPGLLAYELPPEARSVKTGLGQVQYWFLFRLRRKLTPVPAGSELKTFAWMSFEQAIARAVKFKRPVYRKLQECFERTISKRR